MEQKTGVGSLYAEFFRGYGAEIRPFSFDFRPNSTYKWNYTPSPRTRVAILDMGRSWGDAGGGPRLSMAGLMALVGVMALDCATVVHAVGYWDQSPSMTLLLLVGVLPMVNVAGAGLLLLLQPPPRR
jgi:hypothetical protein